ncbi:MAG: hypothetical protein H7831_06425 [Magnetococcus sp. WYHC-3]
MNEPVVLLSWVDVAGVLRRASQHADRDGVPRPPPGVVYTQTYWDRLLVGVAPGTDSGVVGTWMGDLFGRRWVQEEQILLLEADGASLSRLSVEIEDLDKDDVLEWRQASYHPRFAHSRTTCFVREPDPPPPPFREDHPPILVFHSFKGGVGRTLCALATTLAYTARDKKVLLVDADFEAPGISLLFDEIKPFPDFSMADLLTLLHADGDADGSHALASAKKGISNQRWGEVYVLPCFRNLQDSVSLEIRPEHLVASTEHAPFFLSDILSRLGKSLGVDLVIVDLRAGLSELSAPWLLDPRVKRILVANASGQSIRGTQLLLQEIGRTLRSNGWPVGNLPALILNQLPASMMPKKGEAGGHEVFNAIIESINETLEQAFPQKSEWGAEAEESAPKDEPIALTSAEEGIAKAYLSYNEPLASLSGGWEYALATIRESLVPERLWEALQLWLPATIRSASDQGMASASSQEELDEKRERLRDFAGKLVTAEGTSEGAIKDVTFLSNRPLVALVRDHASRLPTVVSIGAKGSGKTYIYLNMARCEKWNHFAEKVVSDHCEMAAPMLPVLWSKNADSSEMQNFQDKTRQHLGLQRTSGYELARELSSFTSEDVFEWRDFWADAIAKSLQDSVGADKPFESLLAQLSGRNQHVIALIDGLEEAFPKFATEPRQQIALRALLQELPNWLRTLRGTPVGLVVFVRQDIVMHAIPQNRTQFTERFKSYALQWTWEEALALAAWVCDNSRATRELWTPEFDKLSESERSKRLVPLWGLKLGGEKSNEAVSNNWVLSVLSDLLGRIQARDVVRFLSLAAKGSKGNSKSPDRILAPAAMRAAIQQCSKKKVDEIKDENAPLKEVFDKITNGHGSAVQSPCAFEVLASLGLNKDHVELLEDNGVIFYSNIEKKYHIPEIFRHGLNVERAVGARPNVVSLIRQVRNQGRF